jgi:hypothetical protein
MTDILEKENKKKNNPNSRLITWSIITVITIIAIISILPISNYMVERNEKNSNAAKELVEANNAKIVAQQAVSDIKLYLKENPTVQNFNLYADTTSPNQILKSFDSSLNVSVNVVGTPEKYYVAGSDDVYIYDSIKEKYYNNAANKKEYKDVYLNYRQAINDSVKDDVQKTVDDIKAFVEQNPEAENIHKAYDNPIYTNPYGGIEPTSTGNNNVEIMGTAKEFYVNGSRGADERYAYAPYAFHYTYSSVTNEYSINGEFEVSLGDAYTDYQQTSINIAYACQKEYETLNQIQQEYCKDEGYIL